MKNVGTVDAWDDKFTYRKHDEDGVERFVRVGTGFVSLGLKWLCTFVRVENRVVSSGVLSW